MRWGAQQEHEFESKKDDCSGVSFLPICANARKKTLKCPPPPPLGEGTWAVVSRFIFQDKAHLISKLLPISFFNTIKLILLHFFFILASYMSPAELSPNSYPQDQYDAKYESGNYGDNGYEG